MGGEGEGTEEGNTGEAGNGSVEEVYAKVGKTEGRSACGI